ncbi:4Fe-4S dicluster domain-containing protein [bacterium]|nr:MAG: 4Fe-4S dicluster domain-containing protein [bacterium]
MKSDIKWRGFKELDNDPDFLQAKEDEFSGQASQDFDVSKLSGISRRKFFALVASSAALAATACSDYRDKGSIVPYNKKPEEVTVGNPNFYASTCTACPNACGILIKTREGRPIKVDGNPDHPINKGKICAVGQASVLNLYDPSRLKEPMFRISAGNFVPSNWQDTDAKAVDELKKAVAAGKEIAIITHTVLSPSQKKLFEDFTAAYPTAKVYSYELYSDSVKRSAFKKAYGRDDIPHVKLNEAKIILALESDFLGTEGNSVEAARMYAENRDVMTKKDFNRLYAVEGATSLTGVNADYRLRLRTDAIEEFILSLLNELIIKKKISSYAGNGAIENVIKNFSLDEFSKKYKLNKETIETLIEDLKENQGAAYVSAGLKLPESAHIAVILLNEVLGASKLYSKEAINQELSLSTKADIENLILKMNSGGVSVVIHFDTNPVYHFSADYKYEEALKKLPFSISMTEAQNETSMLCNYAVAINHNFESWGDYKTRTGVYSLGQPVIAPLYKTRQKEAALLYWAGGNKDAFAENIYMNYIKANCEKIIYAKEIFPAGAKTDFKSFWFNSLHDGVVTFAEKASALSFQRILSWNPKDDSFDFKPESFASVTNFTKPGKDFAVILNPSHFVGDGRFANNGWLGELPNPVSKVVWDNYAAISPATAKELNVKSNDNIDVSAGGKMLTLPAFVQPGMADGVVSIDLGYGRTSAGPIGTGNGFNAVSLISAKAPITDWFYNDAKVIKSTGTYEIVSTQEHYPIDEDRYNDIHLKREIIQEGVFEEYIKDPKFLKKEKGEVKLFNIVPSYQYTGLKWAMSIDLNKCTGCNHCTVACSVENNIPVVGKEQVMKNREMMWIRIDRYYGGHSDDPRVSFQPMLCQHCDNAPCENVCPVSATNHSPDGLNQMAYNRCVGTRYCSNNCPYKVRRFNYFNFRDNLADGYYQQESLSLLHNPEVTVRSRGVMEKCTFCIQRIMDEKSKATQQNRDINGDNVKTACQEACPTNAIVFGDSNKKDSDIVKYRDHDLGYHVLEEINVRPNVTYIAKLRNIKPEKKA